MSSLRVSVDEVASMAEELGLSSLLSSASPKSKGGVSSPKKVTKDVIYKRFEKTWDRATHGVLKDRYDSKPHKPPVLDKRDLSRLADPIKGKYKSLEEYRSRVSGDDGSAFLTDLGIEDKSENRIESSIDNTGSGIFLTENLDGSVSPQKGARVEKHTRINYNRSHESNNSTQGSTFSANFRSRNGAVSRLRGKLDEAARVNYRKNRGLQSSVLDTGNNSISRGARFGRGDLLPTQDRNRAVRNVGGGGGTNTNHLRSVRSSGYGVQNNNSSRTGGAHARSGRASDISSNATNRSVPKGLGRARGVGKPTAETRPGDDETPPASRGRKYTRPGVPRLSKQPAGLRSKSRGRGTDQKENKAGAASGGAEHRSRSASRTRSRSRSRMRGSAAEDNSVGGTIRGRTGQRTDKVGDRDSSSSIGRRRGTTARSGSSGGGLAAIRERRRGVRVPTPADTAAARGKTENVDFKRLGVIHGPTQRQRAEERTRRNKALIERRNQCGNQRTGSSNVGLRKTESAPTTVRPTTLGQGQARGSTATGSVDTKSGRAGTRTGARAGEKSNSHTNGHKEKPVQIHKPPQKQREASSDVVIPKGEHVPGPKGASTGRVEILDGRISKAKATSARQLADGKAAAASVGTTDIMKTLVGVQASEAKRKQDSIRITTDENSVNASASGPRKAAGAPLQALNMGPGGRSAKGGAREGGPEDNMAAMLAAKAAKLQSQFDEAAKIASHFTALDEAEGLARSMS